MRKATQGYPKVQYRIRIQITRRLSSQQPHIPLQELRNTNTQYGIQKCGQAASFQAIHTCPYAGPSTKCDAVHTKYENHLKKGGWSIRKWAGEYGAENTKCKLYSTRLIRTAPQRALIDSYGVRCSCNEVGARQSGELQEQEGQQRACGWEATTECRWSS